MRRDDAGKEYVHDDVKITNEDAIAAWSAGANSASFGEEGDFARVHLLNPALFSLLGDVSGKSILDAGCGQGYLSRMLARRGAHVTGVEPAESLFRYAKEREQTDTLGIRYLQCDLSRLTRLEQTYDTVVANMVFMDIPDYESALRNCVAALKPGGHFVFSLCHPCFDEHDVSWDEKGCVEVREYFRPHGREQTFSWLFHRPLSAYINLLLDTGCLLRRVVEPQLPAGVAGQIWNDRDEHVPSFIVIAAAKSGGC